MELKISEILNLIENNNNEIKIINEKEKIIKELENNFYDFVRKEVSTAPYSPEIEKSIISKYNELQDRKFEATRDLANKVRLFSNIDYVEKKLVNGKEVSENKKLGINGVYTSATNNAQFKADNELLYALSNSRQSIDKGIFVPDIFTGQNKLLNSLMSKHYTPQEMIQVNKALANASQEYFKRNRKLSE